MEVHERLKIYGYTYKNIHKYTRDRGLCYIFVKVARKFNIDIPKESIQGGVSIKRVQFYDLFPEMPMTYRYHDFELFWWDSRKQRKEAIREAIQACKGVRINKNIYIQTPMPPPRPIVAVVTAKRWQYEYTSKGGFVRVLFI